MKIYRYIIIILAILGMASMGYLVKLHYSSDTGGSFCNIGEGLSCDIVNKSEYSEILGIPMSILGLLYFTAVLIAMIWKYNADTLKLVVFSTITFLGPSLYLSYIEFFVIKNICIFCEFSKSLMFLIIIMSWLAVRPAKIASGIIISALIAGLAMAGATFLIQSNSGPGEKYNEFAQCLDEKGFKMYGSVTCAFCARQRAMFGDAFKYIEEVECDPRNAGNVAELCISKEIEKTPTWIQEDPAGQELYRFEKGLQSMDKLSEVSGCALPD